MGTKITFEPDVQSLAQADQLATEQGVTLEQIATEAFAAYMARVADTRRVDLDEGEQH